MDARGPVVLKETNGGGTAAITPKRRVAKNLPLLPKLSVACFREASR
jgi:hypothetical protein